MTDYRNYEAALSASYNLAAEQYRRDDEIEVRSENHRRLCGNLGRMSGAFGREIDVLDAGCGTGRHFHCLNNVRCLVGLDISIDMLHAAAKPVRQSDVTARQIELIRGSIYEQVFPAESFDLIYSIGCVREWCKGDARIMRHFSRMAAARRAALLQCDRIFSRPGSSRPAAQDSQNDLSCFTAFDPPQTGRARSETPRVSHAT